MSFTYIRACLISIATVDQARRYCSIIISCLKTLIIGTFATIHQERDFSLITRISSTTATSILANLAGEEVACLIAHTAFPAAGCYTGSRRKTTVFYVAVNAINIIFACGRGDGSLRKCPAPAYVVAENVPASWSHSSLGDSGTRCVIILLYALNR